MLNQNELRRAVKRRCMSQKEIANELGITNIYLNYWLKGKKELGKETENKIIEWLKK